MTNPDEIQFSDIKPTTSEAPIPDPSTSKNEIPPKAGPRKRTLVEKVMEPIIPDEKIPYRKGQFIKPMTELYGGVSMIMMPINPNVAKSIALNAQQCGEAWDQLASENPAIRKWIKSLLTTNAAMTLAIAHFPILMVIAFEIPAVKARFANVGDQAEEFLQQQGDPPS